MSRKDLDFDQLLDQAVAEIHDEGMSPEAERAAAERVWQRVSDEALRFAEASPEHHQIRNCDDFQALRPAYLQGALTEAKALLVEDHLGECVPCRRALKRARSGQSARSIADRAAGSGSSWVSTLGWRVAAAAVFFIAVVGLSLNTEVLKVQAGGLIHIEAVEGELLRVTDEGTAPVRAGESITLGSGEGLRTTKGSRAMLKLADDSAVEMSERAELAVFDRHYFWNGSDGDAVIDLARGSVIVDASDQGSGHLFVNTEDSKVAVKGTVFAVNHGIKGTRVSVLEGEVEVDYVGATNVVRPGEQITTRPELEKVPLAQEIAWSGNLDQHLALLRELTALGREIDEVLRPELRYSTQLLDLVPDDTVVYVGIPNVSDALPEAHRILENKIGSSEALRTWWEQNVVPTGGDQQLKEIIDEVSSFGDQLGEEIVVTLQSDEERGVHPPLLLAQLKAPGGFRSFLEDRLTQLEADHGGEVGENVAIVEGERPDFSGLDPELFVWIRGDLLVVSFEREPILRLAADWLMREEQRATGGLFHQRLAELYHGGVEWVVGVDFERILGSEVKGNDRAEMEGLGLLDMQHLIGEREQRGGHTENRVTLTFGRTRRGLASWLDEPAPMGSLDFISPNATLAAAFVMREPAALVDELFGIFGSLDADFNEELAEFQRDHGIDFRNDFAAPLGGEFAFALDGPVLPKPSWKLIVEVYDPARLQRTLEWSIGQLNEVISQAGRQGLSLSSEEASGRTIYRLESLDTGIAVQYTFVDGYLVAGPSRSVVLGAIQTRDLGISLPQAATFTSMLPSDARVNFSAMVFQNLGSLLGPLASLGSATSQLTPDQEQIVQELAANARPSLTLAYGADDRITFVYTHEGGFLSSGLASFFSIRTLADMQELVGHALDQGAGKARQVDEQTARESS